MGSVGSVSRDPACPCAFSASARLNGVQEVACSNPVAKTNKARRNKELRRAFSLPRNPYSEHFARNGRFSTVSPARSDEFFPLIGAPGSVLEVYWFSETEGVLSGLQFARRSNEA